jgi:endonuclease-3 related protein
MHTFVRGKSVREAEADGQSSAELLMQIYHRLYRRYGPQGWWPGDGPLDVVIGAILTQSAAWTNVEKAMQNLKNADCWSLESIDRCAQEELASIIRPSGYFNAKSRKLKAFAHHVCHHYSGDLEAFFNQETVELRSELLSIHGVGPETADDILVYAAGKPSFVIDAYTRRIMDRMGLINQKESGKKSSYEECQSRFQDGLPADVQLYNEYHALLDQHAKVACAKVPRCSDCCLLDLCLTGRSLLTGSLAEDAKPN